MPWVKVEYKEVYTATYEVEVSQEVWEMYENSGDNIDDFITLAQKEGCYMGDEYSHELGDPPKITLIKLQEINDVKQ